jgi:hypothetical protein
MSGDGAQREREYDDTYAHRLQVPLRMLQPKVGERVVRVEHCYRCERETPHESTYVGSNTWESYCLAHSETMRRKQWETAQEPRGWNR